MNPEQLDSELRRYAEGEEWLARHCRILNSPLPVIGVKMGHMRDLAKRIVKEDDWREFLSEPAATYEHCIVKALVIATAKTDEKERLALSKVFLPEIRDWSVCDTFCGSWRRDKGGRSEGLWQWCISLLGTGEEFPMRVGAVMMMSQFLEEDRIDLILAELTVSRESPGYYWDMGCAWALSFCYIDFPERTEREIFSGRLSPEILTMTVGKIRDSYRVPEESKRRTKARLQETRKQFNRVRRPSPDARPARFTSKALIERVDITTM